MYATLNAGNVVQERVQQRTVVIQEQGFDAETYTIVGAAEANPREGKMSNESPIGKAILNHEVAETVTFETPSGMYKVKIIKVK